LSQDAILKELKSQFGVERKAIKLFKSYLTDRKATVRSGEYTSQKMEITSGIPQGSILGPTLFSVAINDIKSILGDINFHIYADDLTIWIKSNNATEIKNKLEGIASELFKYFAKRGLKINSKKCQNMYIGSKKKVQEAKMAQSSIRPTFLNI
jgi:hypothetical protein